jgi:tetratricopeptide (TPR) repeat protein
MPMSVTAFALALIAVPLPVAPESVTHLQPPAQANDLAAQPLAAGHGAQALDALERASTANPHDPALQINLGIAYAQAGEDAKARDAFERAAACHEIVELDTADGTATDSRRLARKALKMLARGEFRPASARAGQLTYRD